MEIKEVSINSIKPDPNQPRKVFNREAVQEMADSFKTVGVISPVELDEDNIIVTGEIRWRAAKLAGLKTVPCKVISIKTEDRLIRQVIENLNHNAMTPWDIGVALKKLSKLTVPGTVRIGNRYNGGIKLSKLIGKSTKFISEHLMLVDEMSGPVQKAVRKGKIPMTLATRVITQVPKKYKKAVEAKMLKGQFKTRDGGYSFTQAIEREQDNPEVIKKLLNHDYSNYKTSQQTDEAVRSISPNELDIVQAALAPGDQLLTMTTPLTKWLKAHPLSEIPKIQSGTVRLDLASLSLTIKDWLAGKEIK